MMWLKPFAFVVVMLTGSPVWADDLIIFAAASLKGPLDEILGDWPDVRVSYSGSGTLARQVQQGAPADVVLLANAAWMDVLVETRNVRSPSVFAGNRLVLIGQPHMAEVPFTSAGILHALDGGRLAAGFTGSVPAGIYAKQGLLALDLWDALAPQLAEVDSVRAALVLVSRGEAPVGIVYRSDAHAVPELRILATFPVKTHERIAYWAAVTTASDHPDADRFVTQLQSGAAQNVFEDAGFCAVADPCDDR